MCGIAGLLGTALEDPVGWALRAGAALAHRGPDDEGYRTLDDDGGWSSFGGDHTDQRLGLAHVRGRQGRCHGILVHRRLAVIDTSPDGHQPMSIDDGPAITYNGEVYNYLELRDELCVRGHRFLTASDTEVVLAAYAEWGERCVEHFVGMWAFAIVDTARGLVFASRDPFGIKPLYFAHAANSFAFCSEIPPLLDLPWVDRAVDDARAAQYLVDAQSDDAEATMSRGVRQLPAGTNLTIDLHAAAPPGLHRYWAVPHGPSLDLSFAEAAARLRDLFVSSVELHLRSDVPVGACLSGGIDSSAIVCAMREVGGSKLDLRTFSYIASEPRVSDERWVDLVAAHVGSTCQKVSPTPDDFGAALPDLLRRQHEPFASTSVYAQHRVFAAARAAGVPVMLDGQGADELLGGYVAYRRALLREAITRRSPMDAARVLRGLARTTTNGRNDLVDLAAAGLRRLRRRGSRRHHVVDPAWLASALPAVPKVVSLHEQLARSIEHTSLPSLLRYEDRNSMAHSIESRVPFLTVEMAEFTLGLPPQYLVDQSGHTKSVFRAAMRGLVPDAILDRTDKIGFVSTEQRWLRAAGLVPLPASFWARPGPVDLAALSERLAMSLAGDGPADLSLWRAWSFLEWRHRTAG